MSVNCDKCGAPDPIHEQACPKIDPKNTDRTKKWQAGFEDGESDRDTPSDMDDTFCLGFSMGKHDLKVQRMREQYEAEHMINRRQKQG
ncbi:hypothetical protein Desti_0588 [Desulfomonile tiedjei DSM 6799]|uniref:Uncharacterized protein n=1 Tax=Desulfomonile tiedjei (strain ATCC 49306 / DSM 6799 / DCB-1) TaxID=706587 RepID=I4C178_DESTA|nr:hypothetical protein Desti_0588 [Desulfomonile tiedjei DSM 6799]